MGSEAKAFCESYILKIRESVLEALNSCGDARTRWTVAHEFGHLALQHPKNVFRKNADEPIRKSDRGLEREANIFAAEFLMPTHLAQKFTTVNDLSTRFQVTLEAASRRLRELKRDAIFSQGVMNRPTKNTVRAKDGSAIRGALPNAVNGKSTIAFVSMSFGSTDMTRLYQEIIRPSIQDTGLTCIRADEIPSVELFTKDIQRAISNSAIVIAEISGFNPNVMLEIGLAQSLEKPTVLICREGYREDQIPSNIRAIRRIMYPNDAGGGSILRRQLTQILLSIMGTE